MGFLTALGGLAISAVGAAIDSCAEDDRTANEQRIAQQSYEQQRQLEEMRMLEAKRQRRHENTTAVINGVFSLLQYAAESVENDNNTKNQK